MSKVEVGKFYKDARLDVPYLIEVLGETNSPVFGVGLIHGQVYLGSPMPYNIFVRPQNWGEWVEISKEEFIAAVKRNNEA